MVSLKVQIPTKLSKDDEEALREVASRRGEDVAEPGQGGLLGKLRSAFQ